MQSRFYHRNAHAAHPTRTLLAISPMPANWELAVESIDLPTRSSAFGWSPNCKASLTSPRCIPADLRPTIETAHGCQLRKLAPGSPTYVRWRHDDRSPV